MTIILNVMFGRKRGGLEQVAVDYHEALSPRHAVTTVMSQGAWSLDEVRKLPQGQSEIISPFGDWDPFAAMALRALAKKTGAEIAICTGNRAVGLGQRALGGLIPVVGVAQNYKLKRFPRCDAGFGPTQDLVTTLQTLGIPAASTFHIPNMVRIPAPLPKPQNPVPVIGSMGRFVEKKGFAHYIKALGALKRSGAKFKALLGGDGELENDLKALAKAEGLGEDLSFTGWVVDKSAFFAQLDIFVLPSLHEPFGIVLIEAMAAGMPTITTDSEGPREIATHGVDALIYPMGDAAALTKSLSELLQAPDKAATMGAAARARAIETYDINAVGKRMDAAIASILAARR